jgi:Protein of unknown function (DUF4238)
MNRARRQHYIPRFYLGGFADPDILARQNKEFIWVYEKGKAVRRSSPKTEATHRDFYSFLEDGSRNVEIEAWLGNLESLVAPIVSSLVRQARHVTCQNKGLALAVRIGGRRETVKYFDHWQPVDPSELARDENFHSIAKVPAL